MAFCIPICLRTLHYAYYRRFKRYEAVGASQEKTLKLTNYKNDTYNDGASVFPPVDPLSGHGCFLGSAAIVQIKKHQYLIATPR